MILKLAQDFGISNKTKEGHYMVNYGLKDKVALITGANNPQGIGATTAFAFAREGSIFWSIMRPMVTWTASTP